MKVAFLGLGAIGAPMARHLAPLYELSVWNRTAARATQFAKETNSHAASSPAEAVRGAAVAITCLPTSREVEGLLDWGEGMFAAFDRGATLVDCTSGDPATSRRIAARLAEKGVGFIDAPVSGGVSGATKGVLTIMCGGDEATMARARPILEAFGEKIVLCGPGRRRARRQGDQPGDARRAHLGAVGRARCAAEGRCVDGDRAGRDQCVERAVEHVDEPVS